MLCFHLFLICDVYDVILENANFQNLEQVILLQQVILFPLNLAEGKCLAWRKSGRICSQLLMLFKRVRMLILNQYDTKCLLRIICLFSHFNLYYTEKKLLQSKLWKASSSGKSIDLNKNSTSRKDISTSTEDLGNGCLVFLFLCL